MSIPFLTIKNRILNSKLFKDSFWAILGNGLGNLLLMLSGILIARLLGKELYGEYGVVKTTMFYIASFATFGLGITSTKYIAQFAGEKISEIRSLVRDSLLITLLFSGLLAVSLFFAAPSLSQYLGEQHLSIAFKLLGCIIVFRALTTTQLGILAGLKLFKKSARNSLISGAFLLFLCVPLTYYFSLKGSLIALLLSQVFNFAINSVLLRKSIKEYEGDSEISYFKELISFSFPVALQESSIWICNWICIMLLTKLSSPGELGLYSAAAQWNAVIALVPSLLSNVILSYIADSTKNMERHNSMVKLMFSVNLCSTFVPFLVVFLSAGFISSFYGPTFSDLAKVLRVLTFNAVLESCSGVFKAEYISSGRAWLFFSLRVCRDIIMTLGSYFLLTRNSGVNGAMLFSYVIIVSSAVYLMFIMLFYKSQIFDKYYKKS